MAKKKSAYKPKSYRSSSYKAKAPKTGRAAKRNTYGTKPRQGKMKKASYKPKSANPKGDWKAACGSAKKVF